MADGNELQRVRVEGFRDVYSNYVTGQIGAYDLTLTFIQLKEAVPGAGLVHEEQVRVTLSPVQFKLLAGLCARLTDAYEQAMAPIALPAHDQVPKRSANDLAEQIRAALEASVAPSKVSSADKLPPAKPSRKKKAP